MSQSAADAYLEAIRGDEFLPATILVSVKGSDDLEGLATQLFSVHGNPEARKLMFSEDKNDRAKAAIFACYEAGKKVERMYDHVRAVSLV